MSGGPWPEWQEGDRCTGCGFWWWAATAAERASGAAAQPGWHSLVPITLADHPELARPVQCGVCPSTAGRAGVWQ